MSSIRVEGTRSRGLEIHLLMISAAGRCADKQAFVFSTGVGNFFKYCPHYAHSVVDVDEIHQWHDE